jgi:hypothetical protein
VKNKETAIEKERKKESVGWRVSNNRDNWSRDIQHLAQQELEVMAIKEIAGRIHSPVQAQPQQGGSTAPSRHHPSREDPHPGTVQPGTISPQHLCLRLSQPQQDTHKSLLFSSPPLCSVIETDGLVSPDGSSQLWVIIVEGKENTHSASSTHCSVNHAGEGGAGSTILW